MGGQGRFIVGLLLAGAAAPFECPVCGGTELHYCEPPLCACGQPAACLGRYEINDAPWSYACNICCAHGNEDGRCYPLHAIPPEVEAEARLQPPSSTQGGRNG